MTAGASDGLDIPGYHVIERLGPCPSFGVWVRAIQVRMDRRVLLKLLPPGLASTEEAFAREIAALVRRDADGVLRVIDEGVARDVRYLVLDEGEGKRLSDLGGLDGAGWLSLGRTLNDLFSWVERERGVLLPVPFDVLRVRPGSEFCTGDLGWIVPLGEVLPAHPAIPPEWVGQAARSGMNRRFLMTTLENVEKQLLLQGIRSPKAWRRVLSEIPTGAGEEQLPSSELWVGEPAMAAPLWYLGGVAIALVMLTVWVSVVVIVPAWRDNEHTAHEEGARAGDPHGGNGSSVSGIPNSNEAGDPRVPSAGDNSGPGTDPHGDRGGVDRAPSDANRRGVAMLNEAAALYDSVVTESTLTSGELERLAPDQVAALQRLVREYPDTDPARSAEYLLESWRSVREEQAYRLWGTLMPPILEALAVEDFLSADTRMHAVIASESRLTPWLEAEIASLRNHLRRSENAALARLRERLQPLIEPEPDRALALIREFLLRIPPERATIPRQWRADLRSVLRLQEGIAALWKRAPEGEWNIIDESFKLASPCQELPWSCALRDRWLPIVDAATAAAQRVRRAAEENREVVEFMLAAPSESIRGRVESVQRSGVSIKIEGRRTRMSLPWHRLTAEFVHTWCGVSTTDWGALLILLGEPRGFDAIPEETAWLAELRRGWEAHRRRQLRELVSSLCRWAERSQWRRFEAQCGELGDYPPQWWNEQRPLLLECWKDYFRRQGVLAAFAGARAEVDPAAIVDADGFVADVSLEFDVGTEQGAGHWLLVGESQWQPNKGGALLKGRARLGFDGITEEMFEHRLEVSASFWRGSTEPPNLNVVIWSRGAADNADGTASTGVVMGLGWKHPNVNSFVDDANRQRLLPATIIGGLPGVERGDFSGVMALDSAVQVPLRRWVPLTVVSDDQQLQLTSWKGGPRQNAPPLAADQRRGSVEIRTYGSEIGVRSIRVKGRLREAWWEQWLDLQARRALTESAESPR